MFVFFSATARAGIISSNLLRHINNFTHSIKLADHIGKTIASYRKFLKNQYCEAQTQTKTSISSMYIQPLKFMHLTGMTKFITQKQKQCDIT